MTRQKLCDGERQSNIPWEQDHELQSEEEGNIGYKVDNSVGGFLLNVLSSNNREVVSISASGAPNMAEGRLNVTIPYQRASSLFVHLMTTSHRSVPSPR
jgi:hypothetical protein